MVIIKTKNKKEIIDLTDLINLEIKKLKIKQGLVSLFLLHTTCALTTADLDPGTDLDMLDAFEKLIPKLNYRHPHNPEHVPDHILSSLIGTSLILPVENSKLLLGTWQRVVLIEFDGPRERKIKINFIS
ncbi:MAG: secondary thiamine-phosphate synthase enzyme YjbQ [Minisyncoccia bacterium]